MDVSADKQLAICGTFADGSFETKVDMLDIFFCPDNTADGVLNKVSQYLQVLGKESVYLRN